MSATQEIHTSLTLMKTGIYYKKSILLCIYYINFTYYKPDALKT